MILNAYLLRSKSKPKQQGLHSQFNVPDVVFKGHSQVLLNEQRIGMHVPPQSARQSQPAETLAYGLEGHLKVVRSPRCGQTILSSSRASLGLHRALGGMLHGHQTEGTPLSPQPQGHRRLLLYLFLFSQSPKAEVRPSGECMRKPL